jgi:hypothetical protein
MPGSSDLLGFASVALAFSLFFKLGPGGALFLKMQKKMR